MELTSSFVPQFRVPLPPIKRLVVKKITQIPVAHFDRDSSYFGEKFPVLYHRWKPIEVHCSNSSQNIQQSSVSKGDSSRLPELSFDRLQLSDQVLCGVQKREFGRYVSRGAVLDEEYWTAAWLRAEAHWEALSYMRHVETFKRTYAEREFYALKRRCSGRDGNSLKCLCLVTVKKEDITVKRTVLNSVVGTLDLSIRLFLRGETYPGEIKRSSATLANLDAYDGRPYAYISNVCVSKFARRQGIASNMLYLAADIISPTRMKQLFVHVSVDNMTAQELYKKTGFKVVETGSQGPNLLMCYEL